MASTQEASRGKAQRDAKCPATVTSLLLLQDLSQRGENRDGAGDEVLECGESCQALGFSARGSFHSDLRSVQTRKHRSFFPYGMFPKHHGRPQCPLFSTP